MPGSREAWERVLAAIEADARRAEALLATPAEEFPADRDEDSADDGQAGPASTGLPADWLLPAPAVLPPLEVMPPVPEELSEHILELRAEVIRLQGELAEALRSLPQSQPRRVVLAARAEVAAYLDRRL